MADERKTTIIYKEKVGKKGRYEFTEAYGDEFICGPRTNSLWFKIKEEHDDCYVICVPEL